MKGYATLPNCVDAMQQHIEELTEERDSLSSKLEKCEAERAKYERWFYEKFGQAFEAEEDLDALLEANRGLQAKLKLFLEGSREALLVMRQIEEALRHGISVEPGSFLHDEVTRLCSGGPER